MENITNFTSRDFVSELPVRAELRKIEKALIRDGYDRLMTVEQFVSTPPEERLSALIKFESYRIRLSKFYISTNAERVLLNHLHPEIAVSDPLGKLIIVSGPSGVGKDTLIQKFIEKNPKIDKVVTATTRQMRHGEQAGVSYHFLSREEFEFLHSAKLLMDRLDFVSNSYGTPSTEMRKRERGDVLVNAVPATKQAFSRFIEDVKLIVIMPEGDTTEEREKEIYKRLQGRGLESEESIVRRISEDRVNFHDWESMADFTIVSHSGDISGSLIQLENIIKNNK